jgi:hypothetical protein
MPLPGAPELIIIISIILTILLLSKTEAIVYALRRRNKFKDSKELLPKRNRQRRRPLQNLSLGSALTRVIAPGIFVISLVSFSFIWAWTGKAVVMFIVLGSIIMSLLTTLGKALSGAAIADNRAPIVYLRGFLGEGSLSQIAYSLNHTNEPTFEEHLQKALSPIGPLVALGKPGTWLQKAGAIRRYVGDDKWVEEITRLIDQARLVMIQVGDSDSLLKEVRIVTERKNPDSILIYLGSKGRTFSDSFMKVISTLRFPTRKELEDGLFLWFNSSGDPIVLKAQKEKQFLTLKPKMLLDIESALEPVVRYFTESVGHSPSSPTTPNTGPQADG